MVDMDIIYVITDCTILQSIEHLENNMQGIVEADSHLGKSGGGGGGPHPENKMWHMKRVTHVTHSETHLGHKMGLLLGQ